MFPLHNTHKSNEAHCNYFEQNEDNIELLSSIKKMQQKKEKRKKLNLLCCYFNFIIRIKSNDISNLMHLVNIVNEFVHLFEPRLSILVLEIITHCPHDVICLSYVGLYRKRFKLSQACCGVSFQFKISHILNQKELPGLINPKNKDPQTHPRICIHCFRRHFVQFKQAIMVFYLLAEEKKQGNASCNNQLLNNGKSGKSEFTWIKDALMKSFTRI